KPNAVLPDTSLLQSVAGSAPNAWVSRGCNPPDSATAAAVGRDLRRSRRVIVNSLRVGRKRHYSDADGRRTDWHNSDDSSTLRSARYLAQDVVVSFPLTEPD